MSTNVYNKYYQDPNYFGKPYIGLQSFFRKHEPKGKVLDLGCGQGRDSIFVSKCGYEVLGIDSSSVGIKQLNSIAKVKGLSLKGIVDDVYAFPITSDFDIVLLDSMFHFYKNDIVKESALITRVAVEIKTGGIICNFMLKGKTREQILKKTLSDLDIKFEVLHDEYTPYPEFNSNFHMYIIKKL